MKSTNAASSQRKGPTARNATVNKNNNQKRVKKGPVALSEAISPLVVLSPCTKDYASALVNPFTGPLACVPVPPIVKSNKLRVWVRGELSTGTFGLGFVAADHKCGAAYDASCVTFTGSAFGGPGFDLTAPLPAGVFTAGSNSPYATTNFSPTSDNAAFRVVACGLRIRYIGTTLNQGGTIIAFVDPTGTSVDNRGVTDILGEEQAKKIPVTRTWTSVLWRPVAVDDYNFWSDSFMTYYTSGAYSPMGFLIESADAAIKSRYEFEYSAIYEVNGRNVRNQTFTQSDPIGASAVLSASQTSTSFIPHTNTNEMQTTTFLGHVAKTIHSTTSHISGMKNVIEETAAFGKTVYDVGKLIGFA